MDDTWSEKWSGACPECGSDWFHYERLEDGRTEHRRVGYTRLSDWTLECDSCGRIDNRKRVF